MKKYLFISIFITSLISSCKKGPDAPDVIAAQTMLNVSYGTDPLQKMDVYLPAGRTSTETKVMIMIHGGAWSSGDKADFTSYVDTMKKRLPGYAIFNINYRLSTGSVNTFPAQENDVKDAVDFVYNKISEYKVSEKFVLLGASAGGHLALLQGYKNTVPVKVKAIVDLFGPTDMIDLYNNPASPLITPSIVALIVGGTPTTHPALYASSSPINFPVAGSPPTIIFHGGLDPLVSATQSVALDQKLASLSVPHQYYFYPNEGHGWYDATLSDTFNKIQAFLAVHVN